MKKKLIAKVQKLNSKLPAEATIVSNSLVIEADDDVMLKRRGILYVTFDLTSELAVDTLLVSKLVHDVLHDAYFYSENISPIQSLEKAIVEVRDKVVRLAKGSSKAQEVKVDFNILVSVLWGNVLYLVQYGDGSSYLMREGDIKTINVASEGNFSVASGVVKDNDVVIIGTASFIDKYPPEKLLNLSAPISSHNLSFDSAALILKFEVDTSFSEDEMVDFGEKSLIEEKSSVRRKKGGLFKQKTVQSKPSDSSVASIGNDSKVKSISKNGFNAKKIGAILVPFLLIALIMSIAWSLRASKEAPEQEEAPFISADVEVVDDSSEEAPVNDTPEDMSSIFYDITVTDENANPTDITVLNNYVVVADNTSGAIYFSAIETPKFVKNESEFLGITSLSNSDGDLAFNDIDGYKVYDVAGDSVLEEYAATDLVMTANYLEFVYSVYADTILKHTRGGGVFESEAWATDEDIIGTVSIAVDGSIYILKEDGELLRFTQGAQDNYEISGLEISLSDPVAVVTTTDFVNVYVADKGNSRIVVLSDEGTVVEVLENPAWSDIRSIGVSPDEAKLFILSGTRVYEVPLVEETE